MLTLLPRTGIVRPVPAAGPAPATISSPGTITGRERVTAAADRLSGDQLALLSLGQNSPGGTIEPPGSPVQITVSLGQTTVPAVRGDRQSSAAQAISKAGLTASTSYINTCVDPGTVQSQDPPAGAQVPLNSQVDIQISTCTNNGGGGPTHQPK
jgi:hypothetical protein